jgi:hypothetical protein
LKVSTGVVLPQAINPFPCGAFVENKFELSRKFICDWIEAPETNAVGGFPNLYQTLPYQMTRDFWINTEQFISIATEHAQIVDAWPLVEK